MWHCYVFHSNFPARVTSLMDLPTGATVSGSCQQHMKELQEELMEDYSINPSIVAKCDREIKTHCGRVEKGGKTLDCLMEKAMEKEGKNNQIEFSQECYEAVCPCLFFIPYKL